MKQHGSVIFQPSGQSRPPALLQAGLAVGGFLGVYAVGIASLGALGMPLPAVPPAAGALAAGALVVIQRRLRRISESGSAVHLKALDRLSCRMDGVRDPLELAQLIANALHKAITPTHLYVWLPAREKRDFTLAAGIGQNPETPVLPEAWIQDFFSYLNGEQGDLTQLPRGGEFSRWMASRGIVLCLPILSQGRLLGLLTCGPKANGKAYRSSDRWLLQQVLRQTALALSYMGLQKDEKHRRTRFDNLTHLYRDAKQQAITDGLTGLVTHLYFQEQLAQRFVEAKRHGGVLSVMLVDIDHFKRFNDSYGHQVGDQVLEQVAVALKSVARGCDTVARYGGEELALVLPQTDLDGSAVVAERAQEAIAQLALFDAKERPIPAITVSIGVAQMTPSDESAQALIGRADAALYQAKEAGRDQVRRAS